MVVVAASHHFDAGYAIALQDKAVYQPVFLIDASRPQALKAVFEQLTVCMEHMRAEMPSVWIVLRRRRRLREACSKRNSRGSPSLHFTAAKEARPDSGRPQRDLLLNP